LWAAAAVGVIAIIVGNIDAGQQRRIMQNQVIEMQTQSTIQRAEIKATLQLTIERRALPTGFEIGIMWTNTGKSEAKAVRGWKTLAFIPMTGDATKDIKTIQQYDFLTPPPEAQGFTNRGIILAGENMRFVVEDIPLQQITDAIAGKLAIVAYGYVEYSDIFGTAYTVRYCRGFNFEKSGTTAMLTLPLVLQLPCEERTEQQKYGR
jgi:hypothetical protein